jgi:hypothetical protein
VGNVEADISVGGFSALQANLFCTKSANFLISTFGTIFWITDFVSDVCIWFLKAA